MPDWDEDSPRLRANLIGVLRAIRDEARHRIVPNLDTVRSWHRAVLDGLVVPEPGMIGGFRGETGLDGLEVRIGDHRGVPSADVGTELSKFEARLQAILQQLDSYIPQDRDPDADLLAAVLDTCAWVHSEWVRIHPFANGNGRTARLWANCVALRYGLPPFVRLRPRPDGSYGAAGEASMKGDWQPTAALFRRMLTECLRGE